MGVVGALLALGSALCFSLMVLAIRRAGDRVGSYAGLLVMLVTEIILSGGIIGLGGRMSTPNWVGVAIFLGVGVLTGSFANILIFYCIKTAGAPRASAAKVGALVVGMALAMLIFGERPGPLALVGSFLVLAGLWVVARPDGGTTRSDEQGNRVLWGLLAGVVGGLAFAVGNLLRKTAMGYWAEPAGGATLEAVAGLVVILLLPRTYRELRELPRWRDALPLAGAGVAGIAGVMLFLAALGRIPVSIANLLSGVEPVITLLLTALFLPGAGRLGRALTLGVVVATAGILMVVAGT
ncbi:MAG: EamA family transporter [Mycobacterium leprae]